MEFFQAPSASDETYQLLRDSDWEPAVRAREFLLGLWECARPFVDVDLPTKAARCLHPHYWELLVANALLAAGVRLVPRAERGSTDKGPDLECRMPRLWVEAVAPTAGDGPDAVVTPVLGTAGFVPGDKIKMRLAGALAKKLEQYATYCASRTVDPNEPYVVAINGGGVPLARLGSTIPHIVGTVFPFGPEYVTLNRESLKVVGGGFYHQPAVLKQGGAPVGTDAFLRGEFAPISALLYSASDACNYPTAPLDRCLLVVHNPLAKNPIPRGVLPGSREYWFEMGDQRLHWQDRDGSAQTGA